MKTIFRLLLACFVLPMLTACGDDDYVASITDLRLVSISPSNVYNGNIATVLGRNFSSVPEENVVTVDGVMATVIEAEKDQIKIIMPAMEPGKRVISVSAPSGVASGLEVTYLKTPDHQYIVQTVVGKKGVNTCIDGFGTDATVGNPTGVNLAPDGDLWFTDRKNNKIRCLSPDQMVSTIIAPTAKTIWQGAFNSKGEYYYVDKDLKLVNRVNPDNTVTTVVDNLTAPLSVEFDKDDNMYVADRDGFCIVRRSAADGAITKTTVGSKGHGPMHIGFDSKGNMYVTRQSSYCIDMVAADGTVTTIAGTGASSKESSDGEAGNPLTANIGHVFGFSIGADGCLYFADSSFHTIRRIVPDENGDLSKGTVETLAGTGKAGYADGKGAQAAFNTPYDVVLTDDCTTMYVTDVLNMLIRKITVK